MKTLKFEFQHFNSNHETDVVDIVLKEEINFHNIVASTLVNVTIAENGSTDNIRIKFEWLDYIYELDKHDFLFIPETSILLFRSTYQWGAICLNSKTLKRHEYANCSPSFYRENTFILILDELYAESIHFDGTMIDHVSIDPPYEMEEFEDRIEYRSLVFGHQVLKTK